MVVNDGRYYHEQQKVWCVLKLAGGQSFTQVARDFRIKYANAAPGLRRVPPSRRCTIVRLTITLIVLRPREG